eukprot:scaffold18886_cov80-Skeletonema_marinoi.AAC.1
MVHQQIEEDEDEEEVQEAFIDIVCCPNELNRSSSQETTTLPSSLTKTAPKAKKLSSTTAVEDTHAAVQKEFEGHEEEVQDRFFDI